MGWRSVAIFILLAIGAGAGGFAWLTSTGSMPWSAPETPTLPDEPDLAPAAPGLAAPAFVAPVIVQAGTSQAEGQFLILQTRRAIETGKPLGDLGSKLQARFGQSHPQALASIINGAKQPISNAALLESFDVLAPELAIPVSTAWDRMRQEVNNLFVIRSGNAEPTALQQQTTRIRESIIAGDIAGAAAAVRKMPGGIKAGDWLVAANRAIAVHQALDLLAQSVAVQPPVLVPAPALAPDPAPVPNTVPITGDSVTPTP